MNTKQRLNLETVMNNVSKARSLMDALNIRNGKTTSEPDPENGMIQVKTLTVDRATDEAISLINKQLDIIAGRVTAIHGSNS